MKRNIFACFILLVNLFFITGCKDKSASKAEKIYKDKGLEAYSEYVTSKNTYYMLSDSNNNGATPLLVAIKEGHPDYVSSFIAYGASVFYETDKNGKDVFDYLFEKTPHEMKQMTGIIPTNYWNTERNIKRLLENEEYYSMFSTLVEENIFSPDYVIEKGKTILMYAAQHTTDIRYFMLLTEKSSDVNKFNDNEWNAVMYAARYNPNPAVLEYLLKNGANTEGNTAGISLTMLASCNPNPGVLLNVPITEKYMHTATTKGKTALMYACENNQGVDVIEILCRDFKENVNAVDSDGKTALMYALTTNKEKQVCEYLLNAGASVEVADKSGKTISNYIENNTSLKDLSTSTYFSKKEEESEN